MAGSSSYKTYQRERRRVILQSAFDGGMKFTNGAIDEGFMKLLVNYDLSNDGVYLIPRPGLRVSNTIAPDWTDTEEVSNSHRKIVACKECVESDGKTYRQFIIGDPEFDQSSSTVPIRIHTSVVEDDEELNLAYVEADGYKEHAVSVGTSLVSSEYSAKVRRKNFDNVHGIPVENENAFDVIGTFGFVNKYYWFSGTDKLMVSEFSDNKYIGGEVPVKKISAVDAVTYGYNMLDEYPYNFSDIAESGKIKLNGILPYKVDTATQFTELQMTPKQNEMVDFRCYFTGEIGKKYKFVWEWRTVNDSEWTKIQDLATATTYTVVSLGDGKVGLEDPQGNPYVLHESFKAPSSEIMVRVQAFDATNLVYVEEAMTMGFDFTVANYGNTSNVKPEIYSLTTASGMTYWQNRLVLYGVKKDPCILFISDLNEPGYFPYPNNITIFNEPILDVEPFMGSLLVFTTSEIHLVSLNTDGVTFNDSVVQTNLYIQPGDISFIQVVKNMVFFKSGNYFYMMVPRAQSATGVLTLAPVSNNILELFNKFENNLYLCLKEVYDYEEKVTLNDFYNYLDYDDIHNVYVFKYHNSRLDTDGYLYFDLIYDTNLRSWRTYMFEASENLKPYRFDATQRGVLVGLVDLKIDDSEHDYPIKTFIEFFKWDIINVSDFRIFPDSDFLFPSGSNSGWTDVQKEALKDLFEDSYFNSKEKKTFFNWQFLDTGYRNDILEHLKRYREIQIQLNNVDGIDLEFGMDFYLDNELRMRWYDYEVEHIIDPSDPNYGQLFITRVVEPNLKIGQNTTILGGTNSEVGDREWEVDRKKVLRLDQSRFPEFSLWKLRMPVSGKGAAPKMKFVSQNDSRYELMTINWVCRVMNAR